MASKTCEYLGKQFTLSYDIVHPEASQSIIILHGWGSNRVIMKQVFSGHLSEYRHIYLDMPGFGKSPNDTVLTTQDYAEIIRLFLDALGTKPVIAMGHSFGGKVATLLNPPCLALLSSSGVLVPKALGVRFKIALFKILKPLKLDRLHQLFVSDDAKGMSREMYETFKNVVNEDFEGNFTKTTAKALLFWGKEDTATPLWSGEKIASLISGSTFYPLSGDHYFFMQHAGMIAETIAAECKEQTR